MFPACATKVLDCLTEPAVIVLLKDQAVFLFHFAVPQTQGNAVESHECPIVAIFWIIRRNFTAKIRPIAYIVSGFVYEVIDPQMVGRSKTVNCRRECGNHLRIVVRHSSNVLQNFDPFRMCFWPTRVPASLSFKNSTKSQKRSVGRSLRVRFASRNFVLICLPIRPCRELSTPPGGDIYLTYRSHR